MTQTELIIIQEFKQAQLALVQGEPKTLVVTATASYIPMDQFRLIFNRIGDFVKSHQIVKLIFDKRQLRVFHQPSMEWYFVEWKDMMFELGLTKHIKILPNDEVFRQSVKIGRKKINELYPNGKFHQLSILYAESLEEALIL
jgi:hypothetical protein